MTASTSASALTHYYSMGAFYAAESGVEMAMHELNQSPATDIDSDGTIGTISNDGNTATDPTLTTGVVYVTKVNATPPRYRATGRPNTSTSPWGNYRRVIEFETE